ncbi:MAG: AraC family transcriptional regulator [Methylococcales bacterium]|jgi:AraC-like DNA-binding protein|nr:AraC family transcriptional regulator [Methylococcales bacterium]
MALTNHAGILNTFWKMIESYGKDPAPIFRKLYLDVKLAEDPSARIPYTKVEALWKEAINLVDDPCIGLKVAALLHPGGRGALGYAWLASSSLREAFTRLVRFLKVTTEGVECCIEEDTGKFSVIHSFNKDALNIPQLVDSQLAILVALCRMNYGQTLDPVAVAFTHSAPEKPGEYFAFFRCPVIFDAPDNRITLTQEHVDKRLTSANPLLAQLHEQVMIDYLAKLEGDNIIERVKAIIIDQLPSGNISDTSVAQALYMSNRTFSRRLQKEGTTLRAILNDLRHELADKYILDSNLNLNEISFLLGFSEFSSFSRAFKRWTGLSPRAYRS